MAIYKTRDLLAFLADIYNQDAPAVEFEPLGNSSLKISGLSADGDEIGNAIIDPVVIPMLVEHFKLSTDDICLDFPLSYVQMGDICMHLKNAAEYYEQEEKSETSLIDRDKLAAVRQEALSLASEIEHMLSDLNMLNE